jgi:hypothetical protein
LCLQHSEGIHVVKLCWCRVEAIAVTSEALVIPREVTHVSTEVLVVPFEGIIESSAHNP